MAPYLSSILLFYLRYIAKWCAIPNFSNFADSLKFVVSLMVVVEQLMPSSYCSLQAQFEWMSCGKE